ANCTGVLCLFRGNLNSSFMPDIQDADSIEIQGSGAKPYVLKNTGGIYSRSCPAWRNQSVPRRMKRLNAFLLLVWGGAALSANADRINHAGRLLGPAPSVTNAVLFNTPEADAILAAMQVFPADSAWNEDISRRPTLTNSDAMIAQISGDLLSTRRTLRAFKEM